MEPSDKLSKIASRSLRSRRLGIRHDKGLGSSQGAAAQGVLAADGVGAPGHSLAQWLGERFNHNFDEYDRAIDSVYNLDRVGGSHLHHMLDGQHSVWGAFRAVEQVRADDTFAGELAQALEHIARDTMSVSGVNPFFSLTPDQFANFGSLAADFGLSKTYLADALTINGAELLGGSVALVSAILMAKAVEPERLSRFSGACLLSATVSANPMLMPIAAAGMANAVIQAKDRRPVLVQGGKGALVSGTAILASTLVGGPAWLGCAFGFMTAVVVSVGLDDPSAALRNVRRLVKPATRVLRHVAPGLRELQIADAFQA